MARSNQKIRRVDQRIYRNWQAFYMAFYSPQLYIDVVKRWRGLGAWYLICLLAMVAIPLSGQYMLSFNQSVYTDFIEPFMQLPSMQIQEGKINFHAQMPYFVKNSANEVVVIVDTTGHIKKIGKQYPKLIGLITEEKIYFRPPSPPVLKKYSTKKQLFPTPSVDTFSIEQLENQQLDFRHWIKKSGIIALKNNLLMGIYPTLVFSFFGQIITLTCALALMGQLSAYALFRYRLNYMAACRLMAVASTCSVVIFFILKTFYDDIPLVRLGCGILSYLYFCYGVWVVREQSKNMANL